VKIAYTILSPLPKCPSKSFLFFFFIQNREVHLSDIQKIEKQQHQVASHSGSLMQTERRRLSRQPRYLRAHRTSGERLYLDSYSTGPGLPPLARQQTRTRMDGPSHWGSRKGVRAREGQPWQGRRRRQRCCLPSRTASNSSRRSPRDPARAAVRRLIRFRG